MRPAAFVFAQGCATAMVLGRLARGRRRREPLRAGASPPPRAEISVVIPARDEALRLGLCLDCLRADPDVGEVIVVDDRSTDATADVARAGGARVVAGQDLPAGWRGKAWALHQGLQAARGDIVLFLDADTRPRPGLARELAALLDEVDLVTAGPSFRCDSTGERLLHPAMAATIPYRTGPGDALNWQPAPSRAIANGQCIAMRRRRLLDAGGWARVRQNMTDDVALARALRDDGATIAFVDASELLEVHMYASARETWNGWSRSLMAPDASTPLRLAEDLAVLWLTMALPLPRLLARRGTPLDVLLLAVRLALHGALKRNYRSSGAAFWFAPLLDIAVLTRLTWSAICPTRSWRGRTYR
ncbi:MAG TPA: glycosyltransferase family 2 protein [Solirubrobacteraceae bacterium]